MAPKKRERKGTAPPSSAPTTRLTRSTTAGKRVAPEVAPKRASAKKRKLAAEGKAKAAEGKAKAAEGKAKEEAKGSDGETNKTVIVEACKQCNSFKTRAVKVKEGLESAVSGITVEINPEKDMKRPFKPMKDLDMDEVIQDIVKKIS